MSAKKWAIIAGVLLLLYYIRQDPVDAGTKVSGGIDNLVFAARQLITFLKELF